VVNDISFYEELQSLLSDRISFVLVTLVDLRGSAPQDIGAKILVTKRGLHLGTVGGGKVEAQVIKTANEILNAEDQNIKQLLTWNLQTDIGMTCGGEVSFYFEAYSTRQWTVVIFGAGHVAQALVPLLTKLDCIVHCIDSRRDWLDRFSSKSNLFLHCIEDPKDAIKVIPTTGYVCLMTQGHSTDVPILKCILNNLQLPYLGMIGSKTKAFRVRKELQEGGFTEEQIAILRSPIGLPIGTNHPTEIAISIAAQLLEVRDSQV
jgi:xanthine dehydrogenase accessory factor